MAGKRGRGRPPKKTVKGKKAQNAKTPSATPAASPPPAGPKRAIKEKDMPNNATKALKELGVIPIK